jgi:hypothetical protein
MQTVDQEHRAAADHIKRERAKSGLTLVKLALVAGESRFVLRSDLHNVGNCGRFAETQNTAMAAVPFRPSWENVACFSCPSEKASVRLPP